MSCEEADSQGLFAPSPNDCFAEHATCCHIPNMMPPADYSCCYPYKSCENGPCYSGYPALAYNGTMNACRCKVAFEYETCYDYGTCWMNCNPLAGPCWLNTYCDDNDWCTSDACGIALGDDDYSCLYGQSCPLQQVYCMVPVCINATQQCTYEEDPNICQGGGSLCFVGKCNHTDGSCYTEPIDCDDQNPCTMDICFPQSGCIHIEKLCNDGLNCTYDGCDQDTGECIGIPLSCDDNNSCTSDYCSEALGGCVHAGEAEECTDYNTCTVDSCDPITHGCSHTPVVCQSPNWCLEGVCSDDAGGVCRYTRKDCNDGDPDTVDFCDLQTQACTNGYAPPDHCVPTPDDGCHFGVLNMQTGGCDTFNVSCDDGNLCTTESCIPQVGCVWMGVSCPAQVCWVYDCNPETGLCDYYDYCNDGDSCTIDSCDPQHGCIHVDKTCDDGNACTIDICVPGVTGCIHVPKDCNDMNACTNDTCEEETGCVWRQILCEDDGDMCTMERCSNDAGGCIHEPRQCGPDTACLTWDCVPGHGCVATLASCDDNDTCTEDMCSIDAGGCVNEKMDCDDSNVCTVDECAPGIGCMHHTILCYDGDACTVDACSNDAGGCTYTPKNCDDGLASTLDWCNQGDGSCMHARFPCEDNFTCTYEVLDDATGSCAHMTVACGDGNPCTVDMCSEELGGECVHNQRFPCEAEDDCHIGYCDPATGTCASVEKDCDDGDWCTEDLCINGSCAHTKIECLQVPCFISWCYAGDGTCMQTPLDCDDHNPMTLDSCVDGACVWVLNPCDPPEEDKCTIASLNPLTGQCETRNRDCNDGNLCTVDSCRAEDGECIHEKVGCDDEDPCTIDECYPGTGVCSHVPKDCRDLNACTEDQCNPSTGDCIHIPPTPPGMPCGWRDDRVVRVFDGVGEEIIDDDRCVACTCFPETGMWYGIPTDCSDGDPCTIDLCIRGVGCKHFWKDCDDGDPCTWDACYSEGGGACVNTPIDCSDGDEYTNDTCYGILGECGHFDTRCGENSTNLCIKNESNPFGECIASTIDCDDGDPFTRDFCIPCKGCIHKRMGPGTVAIIVTVLLSILFLVGLVLVIVMCVTYRRYE
jgi:hypothetical protein